MTAMAQPNRRAHFISAVLRHELNAHSRPKSVVGALRSMRWALLVRRAPMIPQPATRPNRQVCDAPRSCTTPRGRCFQGWSGYPSIAAHTEHFGTDLIAISRHFVSPDRRDGELRVTVEIAPHHLEEEIRTPGDAPARHDFREGRDGLLERAPGSRCDPQLIR
jgi:hypothetical protein